MKSITIHNLDEITSDLLEAKSKEWGLSLNKTIKRLLKDSLGIPTSNVSKQEEFVEFFGTWSQEDLDEFEKKTADTRLVDPGDWK